jgi:predicted RNase H-like HicB family nuclease
MNQETYGVFIFWSDEDEAFIASVPELPGCIAHGKTRGVAVEQIEIAIQNWLETARELGREIPKLSKRTSRISDYIKELVQRAEQRADQAIKSELENALILLTSLREQLVKLARSDLNIRREGAEAPGISGGLVWHKPAPQGRRIRLRLTERELKMPLDQLYLRASASEEIASGPHFFKLRQSGTLTEQRKKETVDQ